MAVVSGRLQIRAWTDKDGNKRRSAEVVADSVYFGDSKRDGDQGGQQSYSGGYNQGGYNQGGGYSQGGNRQGGYGQSGYNQGYTAPSQPAPAPTSDFAMLEDDDSELPF